MTTRGGLLLRGGDVVTPHGLLAGADVRVDDGVITHVGPGLSPAGAELVDARSHIVAPGFIDLHVHGAGGAMCESGDADQLETISRTLARFGTTGFMATIATLAPAALHAAVRAVAAAAGNEPGARILGINLEGPYLNPQRAGAQDPAWMRPPSIEEFDRLQDLCGGMIRLVTVAPEVAGAIPFIREVRERGVVVAAGHSNATEAEMELAVQAGVTHITHMFNAMRQLHQREPGILGVALTDDRLSTELICDGHHLSEHVVDLALRCKPRGKVVLISDAVAALGLPEGEYEMFGVRCLIANGAVRLATSGQLAGSCLTLNRALRNLRQWQPARPLADLVHAAAQAPAQVAGLSERRGAIAPGQEADLVMLAGDFSVVRTWRGGTQV
ncbi:MAG: N-acetylglucosamine-6-phosphate deacetylase [Deltaproteobacteria bacterium]|nr:N-acetylglucosamine-6-phosphate deacetylase [Deltaproteobacteria bacterium]